MTQYLFKTSLIVSWILFLGWFILPVAIYGEQEIDVDNYFWVMGVGLPFYFFVTKASIVSVVSFVWSVCKPVLFPPLKIHWIDACCLIFVLSPIMSLLGGNNNLFNSFEESLYLLVVWGGPYLLGRLVVIDNSSIIKSAEIFVIISLLGSPFFLVEFFAAPIFYESIYGFHPFTNVGVERFINYRPMLLLEDGNQLGMWYMTAAFISFGLWKFGKKTLYVFSMKYVHLYLLLMLLLSQSKGAIILYVMGVVFTLAVKKIRGKFLVISFLVILTFTSIIPILFGNQLYSFAKTTNAGHQIVQLVKNMGGRSLTWRIGNDFKNADVIKKEILTGTGSINWSLDDQVRSWGAIMLILGGYGAIGLLAWSTLLLYPTYYMFRLVNYDQYDEGEKWIVFILATVLLLNWLDAFLNSFFIVVLILWSGSIITLGQKRAKIVTST